MGLDTVEIVLRIEEAFGVHLPEAELAAVLTVGDLYRLTLLQLDTRPSYLTSRSFHRLRRALMERFHLPRKQIRPATKLAALLPKPTRIAAWQTLAADTELQFPPLRHPRWARDVIRLATAAASIAAFVAMVDLTSPSGLFWLPTLLVTTATGLVTFRGLYALTSFLATEFPARTVGELASLLLTMNFEAFASQIESGQPLSQEEVWHRIVLILSDQVSLDPGEITPKSRIVEDLQIS